MKNIQIQLPYIDQQIIVDYWTGIEHLQNFVEQGQYDKILFLFDDNVFKKYGNDFKVAFATKESCYIQLLPNSISKDIDYLTLILRRVAYVGLSRKSLVVCVGGGYVSDIGGVFAGLYMRGIDFVQFSTTLMSQADCVIGKVWLNVSSKKNFVGLFNSPVLTICDVKYLESLQKKELIYAMSEVYKHNLIATEDLSCGKINFSLERYQKYLEEGIEYHQNDWIELVAWSISIKKYFVEQDVYDTNGLHKWLSLGHTIANVIETLIPDIKHWEAVWIGIYISLLASEIAFPEEEYKILLDQIQRFLPFHYSKHVLQFSEILDLLKNDKLSAFWSINLVLFEKAGSFKIVKNWSEENIHYLFSNVFTVK